MNIVATLSRTVRALFTPQTCLIWGVSLWLMLTGNHALFEHLLNLYPWNAHNAGFIISISLFFTFTITLWLMLLSHGKSARWVLSIIVVSAAWAAFYMDLTTTFHDLDRQRATVDSSGGCNNSQPTRRPGGVLKSKVRGACRNRDENNRKS